MQSRTPDSPESARVIAPKSPISPKSHSNSLAPPRSVRNGSASPIVNGSTTPPPASSASTPHETTTSLLQDRSRALSKLRKFLGALVQFAQDTSVDVGDRVRALVLSLASGGLTSEEFKQAIQEAANFPLRPYVLPFLKSHIPLMQRDIANLAKANNQSTLQYVRSNENSVFEFVHTSTEHTEIFMPMENAAITTSMTNGNERHQSINGSGVLLKRRASESVYDHQTSIHEWADYMLQSKRPHLLMGSAGNSHLFPGHPPLFDYQSGPPSHLESFAGAMDKNNHRDERDIRNNNNSSNNNNNLNPDVHRSSGNSAASGGPNSRLGGEEEWKNIHTMLNCISAMVDKTKRAITILQQRGVETSQLGHPNYPPTDSSIAEIKRQTEEKVAEFRRNAEEAVNQVKRQAVIEIQRAVAAAESRAVEVMAQERIKMEKMFAELHKSSSDDGSDRQSPTGPGTQNACWNCGRKANETCSGCNLARYCGSFCQHKDWEQHHQICGSSRGESNGHKHTGNATRPSTAIPPTRSSPTVIHQQQSAITISSNAISTANGVK